ncbi:zinc finger protein 260-like [Lineus longissimus]|uniref:zinc finger protein 260-like n=1 Tax=Lineus longissimus TaxID=88925 RepID=UPI00315C4C88
MDEPQEEGIQPSIVPPSRPSAKVCQQELHPDWNNARDPSGDVYYYNNKTNQTQWNPPIEKIAANLAEVPILTIFVPLQTASTGHLNFCEKVTGRQESADGEYHPKDAKAASISEQQQTSIGMIPSLLDSLENVPAPVVVSRTESNPVACLRADKSPSEPITGIRTTPEKRHTSHPITSKPFLTSARFQCLRCSQSFPHKHGLDKDSCISGACPYTCEDCNQSFSLEEELQQHLVYCGLYNPNDHALKGVYICKSCSKSFTEEEHYRAHVLYCGLHKPIDFVASAAINDSDDSATKNKCLDIINVASSEKFILTANKLKDVLLPQHEIGHQNDSKPIPHKNGFQCPYCKKVISLIIHIRSHTGERPYACSQCNKTYAERGILNRHVRLVHKREKANTSSGDRFVRSAHKDNEVIRTTEEKCSSAKNCYICESCNKPFSAKEEFQQHVLNCGIHEPNGGKVSDAKNENKDVAKKEIVVMTEEQFKDAFSPGHKKDPLNDVHLIPQKNGFKCPYCEKVSAQKTRMVIHIRSHTGERPYACSRCNKRYAERSKLNRHMRVIHNGDLPTPCSGERFIVVSAS